MILPAAPCEHCLGPTEFIVELSAVGSDPGHRVYFCQACKRHTWTTWRHGERQQQSQPKDDEPKE